MEGFLPPETPISPFTGEDDAFRLCLMRSRVQPTRWLWTLVLALGVQTALGVAPSDWEPMLADYCFECHDSLTEKGGIDLESALDDPLGVRLETWEKVTRQLQLCLMPPIEETRPTEAGYRDWVGSLESALDAHAREHPNPGRTESLRRLTRTEYRHAIRDLLSLNIDAAELLPADSASHGFDNVTVGDLSPALLDRYIGAAQKISQRALGRTGSSPDGLTVRLPPDLTQEAHVEELPLGTQGGTRFEHVFPRDGIYRVVIHLMRDRDEHVEGLNGEHVLQVLLDGEVAADFVVEPPKNSRDHTKVDQHLVADFEVEGGDREVGVTFVAPPPDLIETLRQPYQSAFNKHRHPRRSPAVYQVSITGPFKAGEVGTLTSRQKLLQGLSSRDESGARHVAARLMRLAYRGDVVEDDLDRVLAFYREAASTGGFEAGMEAVVAAILVSPKFLFRVERDPEGSQPGEPYRLSDREIASRLAFFLWSSLPDEALLVAADTGELTASREGIVHQVKRMLADDRAMALVENFGTQWLYLRNLEAFTPDGRLYPDFDDNLRQAMRRETELLLTHVLREDRPVLELLRSDFTFLNERLAKHYGIPHVYGSRFRRVALDRESRRGGLLRHASVLTVTSYATRTSPVLRGHWVLENLLGTPPPPPPDVPALEDNPVDASLPVRQRLAAHRENPACAQCHDVMDPLGFAFENFDAVGRWREREGDHPVDATGSLPDGTPFDGIGEFESGLLARPELFVRALVEKLVTYALGRGIEPTDAPFVRQIVRVAERDDYRLSSILSEIAASALFTMRMPNPERPTPPPHD